MIVGAVVIGVGIVNLLLLVEFPEEKGVKIDEDSHILAFKDKQALVYST